MSPRRLLLTPWSRMPRLFAGVLLGLQALLWGGGSILEARAAAESLARSSHVEDQGNTTCPPIHSHLDCIICRTLTGAADTGSAPELPVVGSGTADRPVTASVGGAQQSLRGRLGSRAPPAPARHALAA